MTHASTSMTYEFTARTDKGRVRSNNEDAVAVDRDAQVAILADGMGGYNAGEVASGMATSVACPWPYPEAKVYDPQGFYRANGAEGPYSVGKWSTWQQGPSRNLDVDLGSKSDRCATDNAHG